MKPKRRCTSWQLMIFQNKSGQFLMRCFRSWDVHYQLRELSRWDDAWTFLDDGKVQPVFSLPLMEMFTYQMVRKTRRLFYEKMIRPFHGNHLGLIGSQMPTWTIDDVRERRRPGYVWFPPDDNQVLEPVFAKTIKELGTLAGFDQSRGSNSLWCGVAAQTGTVGLVTVADQ